MTTASITPAEPEDNGEDGFAEGPDGDQPMSFWDHIGELRNRLMKAALGVIIGFAVCFTYATELRELLAIPLHKAWVEAGFSGKPQLNALGMMDVFITDMRVAIAGALFTAGPVIFYQFWMFISPGLYSREKKFAIPFVLLSMLMFVLGAMFCYFVVLPWTIQWLFQYGTTSATADTQVVYQLTINNYIRDATKILLAFGCVFEFPLLVAFLSAAGAIDHNTLLRFWKISVVLIFVMSAFLTPPEPVSQFMMAAPMIVLFFISVGVAYLITKSKRSGETSLDTTDKK